MAAVKDIEFLGSSRDAVRSFPAAARRAAGFELRRLQMGENPLDFKPLAIVGAGVEELRIWVSEGTYRVIYYARETDVLCVLHAFEKKTQATTKHDLDLGRRRFAAWKKRRSER